MGEKNLMSKRLIIRAMWLVFLAALGPSSFERTGLAQRKDRELTAGERVLSFELVTSQTSKCRGSALTLNAEVTNLSNEDIAIDTNGLRYRISVEKFRVQSNGASNNSLTKQGDYGPGQYSDTSYLILRPGRSYRTKIIVSLRGDFFQDVGKYQVSATYGQFRHYSYKDVTLLTGTVNSNAVAFRLNRCKGKE